MKTRFFFIFLFAMVIPVEGQQQNLLDKCVIEGRTAKHFTTADTIDILRMMGLLDSTVFRSNDRIHLAYWDKTDITNIKSSFPSPSKHWYFTIPLKYDTVNVKTYITHKGKSACPNCNTGEWEDINQSLLQLIPTTDITKLGISQYPDGRRFCEAICNNCGNLFVYKSYRLVEK